ncbi:hypothetical protein D3C85_801050 [compost metagenome]
MKKIITLFAALLIVSCSNDEKSIETATEFSQPSNLKGTYCFISGRTVFYDQVTNIGSCIAKPGSTANFIYNSSFKSKSTKWTIISAEPNGCVIVNGNDNQSEISITFGSNFERAMINATGESEKGELCGPTLLITK